MRNVLMQVLGLAFLVLPLAAIRWNLAGAKPKRSAQPSGRMKRWRLELYSNQDDIDGALVDRSDIPFPTKQVASARGQLAQHPDSNSWALPRLEFDVDIDDPFTDEALSGLFGPGHRVRYVTGNEAVIDAVNDVRVRVRALAFK